MNKFWSVLFFAVALALTWNLIHSNSAVGSETHSGIQGELATMIVQSVQTKKPNAKDVRITRLWTETIDDNKVHAVFAYSYTEQGEDNETLQQTIEGEATLHREPSDDARLDKWVLQNVHTTGDSMTFSEGAVVTPMSSEGEAPEGTDVQVPPAQKSDALSPDGP